MRDKHPEAQRILSGSRSVTCHAMPYSPCYTPISTIHTQHTCILSPHSLFLSPSQPLVSLPSSCFPSDHDRSHPCCYPKREWGASRGYHPHLPRDAPTALLHPRPSPWLYRNAPQHGPGPWRLYGNGTPFTLLSQRSPCFCPGQWIRSFRVRPRPRANAQGQGLTAIGISPIILILLILFLLVIVIVSE